MNYPVWMTISGVYEWLEKLRHASREDTLNDFDLETFRQELRNRLELLKVKVTELYSERDAYYLVFPLVAHADELVNVLLPDYKRDSWVNMQRELYDMDNAGDVVFELLDSLLLKPETPALVHEVFYFCINDGFSGRYAGNIDRLEDYKQRLRERIPLCPVEEIPVIVAPLQKAPLRIPPAVSYVLVVCLLLLVYSILVFFANAYEPA